MYSSYKRITFQPVLIKLDCKRCHSLHGLVGECHVHINLSLTPTKCPWKTNSIKLEWSKSNFFRCCQFNVKLTCDENEETINWNVLIHHKILGWSLHSNLVAPPISPGLFKRQILLSIKRSTWFVIWTLIYWMDIYPVDTCTCSIICSEELLSKVLLCNRSVWMCSSL